MRNNKLLILLILGMFLFTVFLAWYSTNRKNLEVVFAQSGPFPIGCVSAQNQLTGCDCTGYTNTGTTTGSTGTTGFIVQDSTCTFPNDPPGSCTQFNNPVAVDNPPCCNQDNDGYNRTSCGGTDCNDDPNNGYNINPGVTEVCDQIDNNCNGQIDEGFDSDGDEWTTCNGDCRDNDIDVYPGAPRWCGFFTGYWDKDCSGYDDELECIGSPIVVDIAGNGFNLTNATNGVAFDLNSDGIRERWSWTSANSDDAWLTLDRNGNSTIDNGQELFGNFTPQPVPPTGTEKNGFLALAEFDRYVNGGNGDDSITAQDAIFQNLRLWQDTNHNGISETSELKTLGELGLAKLELKYKKSKRTDEHGNEFRYRAKVKDIHGAQIGRWAWDVFLVAQPPNN